MKEFVWFSAGLVAGMFSLAVYQQIQRPKASFDDLKIAAAPSVSPEPSPRAVRVSNTAPPVQYFNGQWTTTSPGSTPRPRSGGVVTNRAQHTVPAQATAPVRQVSMAATNPKGEEVAVL